jgi:hypothetical protein
MFPALSRVTSKLQASSCNFRAFSLSHGRSRPAPSAISSRSFFSSSEGPRPSLLEVVSIMKLKVSSVFFIPIRSLRSETSFDATQLAHYGTWFVGGTVVLVIVNVILRGMKRWQPVVISTGFVCSSCIPPFLILRSITTLSFMDMSLEQAANYGLMLGSCSTAFAVSLMRVAPASPLIKLTRFTSAPSSSLYTSSLCNP